MIDEVVITADELQGAFSNITAVGQLVERIGFAEVLSCLATRAETNARFSGTTDLRDKWRRVAKKLIKQSNKAPLGTEPWCAPPKRGKKGSK